jgi:hypothetical protein
LCNSRTTSNASSCRAERTLRRCGLGSEGFKRRTRKSTYRRRRHAVVSEFDLITSRAYPTSNRSVQVCIIAVVNVACSARSCVRGEQSGMLVWALQEIFGALDSARTRYAIKPPSTLRQRDQDDHAQMTSRGPPFANVMKFSMLGSLG